MMLTHSSHLACIHYIYHPIFGIFVASKCAFVIHLNCVNFTGKQEGNIRFCFRGRGQGQLHKLSQEGD